MICWAGCFLDRAFGAGVRSFECPEALPAALAYKQYVVVRALLEREFAAKRFKDLRYTAGGRVDRDDPFAFEGGGYQCRDCQVDVPLMTSSVI